MPLILGANSLAGGYQVKNSTRFASGDSLTRTVTASSATSYTVSFWLKLSDQTYSSTPYIFSIGSTAGNGIYLDSADRKIYFFKQSTSSFLNLYNGVLRDPSAWYHIVWSVSSGTGTGYINGITGNSHSSIPALNDNTGTKISIHDYVGGGYNNVGCYLSEYYFIDGQALTPSSFGETDEDSGIWKPKAYTGTYGTNGFYLQFKNSASLGTDSSGNGNNFTVNNLTSVDQSTDTPTNNFTTLNPLLYSTLITYTEGNLKFTNTSSGQRMVASSIAPTTGKWYAECRVTSLGGNYPQVGVLDTSIYTMDTYVGALARGYGYASHGQVYNNAGALTTGLATYTTNDIIGVALDLDNNYVYFSKNGTFINSGVPTSGSSGTGGWAITDGYDYSFGSSSLDSGTDPVFDWNFGSPFYSANSYTDGAGYGNFSYA
ncbi:MAG: hypothetical protein EB137_02505, partial [Actinobacteria bacterium]|nr:hypothetical protein [Actinomycetota bacterium]